MDQTITNYLGTGGIAVLTIMIYYITAFDPTRDPFAKAGKSSRSFAPNQVDQILLQWIRCTSKRLFGVRNRKHRFSTRFEYTFIKVCSDEADLKVKCSHFTVHSCDERPTNHHRNWNPRQRIRTTTLWCINLRVAFSRFSSLVFEPDTSFMPHNAPSLSDPAYHRAPLEVSWHGSTGHNSNHGAWIYE